MAISFPATVEQRALVLNAQHPPNQQPPPPIPDEVSDIAAIEWKMQHGAKSWESHWWNFYKLRVDFHDDISHIRAIAVVDIVNAATIGDVMQCLEDSERTPGQIPIWPGVGIEAGER
jgi:hypothetical protein